VEMGIKRPHYLPIPQNTWNKPLNIKIANQEGISELYRDKRYNEIPHTLGENFWCHCGKRPQTVCVECLAYLCEEHLYRHPDCEVGR